MSNKGEQSLEFFGKTGKIKAGLPGYDHKRPGKSLRYTAGYLVITGLQPCQRRFKYKQAADIICINKGVEILKNMLVFNERQEIFEDIRLSVFIFYFDQAQGKRGAMGELICKLVKERFIFRGKGIALKIISVCLLGA